MSTVNATSLTSLIVTGRALSDKGLILLQYPSCYGCKLHTSQCCCLARVKILENAITYYLNFNGFAFALLQKQSSKYLLVCHLVKQENIVSLYLKCPWQRERMNFLQNVHMHMKHVLNIKWDHIKQNIRLCAIHDCNRSVNVENRYVHISILGVNVCYLILSTVSFSSVNQVSCFSMNILEG